MVAAATINFCLAWVRLLIEGVSYSRVAFINFGPILDDVIHKNCSTEGAFSKTALRVSSHAAVKPSQDRLLSPNKRAHSTCDHDHTHLIEFAHACGYYLRCGFYSNKYGKCTKFGKMLTAFIWHYWRCKFTQKSCQIFSGDNYYMYSTLSVVLYVCTHDAMVQEVHVHAEIVSSEPSSVPLHVPWFIFFIRPQSFGDSALIRFHQTNHLHYTQMNRDVFIGLTLAVKLWETTTLSKHKIWTNKMPVIGENQQTQTKIKTWNKTAHDEVKLL